MKTILKPIAVNLALAIGLTAASSALAHSYSVTWFTIDGGGGTSTGGVYSISGSIGQPDAQATMTGGAYSLTGGFWALPVAVPNHEAPTLTIVPAGAGLARVSWAPNTAEFALQERASVSTGTWTDSPSGTNNPGFVPTTFPSKFYRLFKP
jgi:hypothetical protein